MYRRELLAIQQAIRHFSTEIQGRHLVVFTDHKAIVGSFKSPNAQLNDAIASNKIMEIAQYTSDVRFVEGKANAVADWLSRPPEVPIGTAYTLQKDDEEVVSSVNAVALSIIDHKTLAKDQKACMDVQNMSKRNNTVNLVEFGPGVKLLCDITGTKARPLVPKQSRDLIIGMYHQLSPPDRKRRWTK